MAARSVLRWLAIGILALTMVPAESRAACGDFGRPDGTEIVEFETNRGSICLELLRADAPSTVGNFLGYVERGDYDGTIIHRSLPGFAIQGGGFRPAGETLVPIPRDPPVMNEPCDAKQLFGLGPNGQLIFICPERGNEQRTVAMAKIAGNPNSATSQWFISLEDNRSILDQQNGGFTVFARVLGETFSVAQAIAALPRAEPAAGFFLGPTSGISFGAVPLLEPVPALDASFSCWDPGDLSAIIQETDQGLALTPDPETGGVFLLSNVCGTQVPPGPFTPSPGPLHCPASDLLGAVLADPITDLVPVFVDPSDRESEFFQFAFTCEQQREALAQRALWQADLWQRMSPQLVVVERATVRVVPEPGDTLVGILALGVLGIVNHACRTRR